MPAIYTKPAELGARAPWRNSFTTAMIRGPLFAEPRGRGWYIADAEMREVFSALYIPKRAAVASIRAMPAPPPADHPLFDNVKEFVRPPLQRMLDILDQGRAARGLPPLYAKSAELGARVFGGILLPRQ